MSRICDTPDLFGVGIGHGTSGDITCDHCGQKYNEGADASGRYLDHDSVSHTRFAGKTICFCCFERIENEILDRMPDILKWYSKILADQQAELEERKRDLLKAQGALNQPVTAWVPVHEETSDVDWHSVITGNEVPGSTGLVAGWSWKQVEMHIRDQMNAAVGFPKKLLPVEPEPTLNELLRLPKGPPWREMKLVQDGEHLCLPAVGGDDPEVIVYRHGSGDVDLIKARKPNLAHLRMALFDAREEGKFDSCINRAELPDGSKVEF